MEPTDIRFADFFKKGKLPYSLTDEVIIFNHETLISKHILNPETMSPVRLDGASACVLCKYGKASFSVNYETHHLSKGSLLMLSPYQVIDNIRIDSNCEAVVLIISRDFAMTCVRDIPIVKKILAASNKRSRPEMIFQLDENQMRNISDIISRIQKCLNIPDHAFQSQMLKSETSIFLMEVFNIVLQRMGVEKKKDEKKNRKDEITSEFVRLIAQNFKEQHEVAFYADKLRMTAGNLSRTIASASKKSPMQWISGTLLNEAKILLRKPDATIKQVADELNFGDQSSFGKFFRKHTGMTPVEYKNGGKKGK